MRLFSLFWTAALGSALAAPSQWVFEIRGKPRKMLQVGRLPALGYNTWNAYGCDINETVVLENAKFITESGLWKAGYEYFCIDDCWMAENRSESGQLVPDYHRFPSGIKSLADMIHSMGMKFGIYESAGYYTCQRLPGSLGFEEKDAELFVSWGVDYLKYDNCGRGEPIWQGRYDAMRDALLKYWDQPILYALCEWGEDRVWEWGNETGHSWRITPDIWPSWDRIAWIAGVQARIWMHSGPFGYGDMDMLEVGNGNLTLAEQRTHFNLWALSKSPLLIGTHLPSLSKASLEILLNENILQINQDPLSIAISPFPDPNGPPIHVPKVPIPTHWSGPLASGETVIMIINPYDYDYNLVIRWKDIPAFKHSTAKLFRFEEVSTREVWRSRSRLGFMCRGVPAHGSVAIRVWEETFYSIASEDWAHGVYPRDRT